MYEERVHLLNKGNTKRLWFLLLIFSISVIVNGCTGDESEKIAGKTTITDDLGQEFVFEKEPESIISLAPNLTEMIYALRLGEKLKGNTIYCNYPSEAKSKVKVGDMLTMDYEKIIRINPDIIFITVEGNSKGSYEKLKDLGFRVFVSNPRNYDNIKKTLRVIAKIFNKQNISDSMITAWDSVYYRVLENGKQREQLKGMFAISTTPLMLCGKNTFMNEFLVDCGIKNIAADSPMNYPVFSREEVLVANPDIMIFRDEEGLDKNQLLEIYPEWKNVNAVKNNRIITVNPDLYFRPGPRFITALKELDDRINKLLHQSGSQ